MPVNRPTFSEFWFRVADLKPRLAASVKVHRQYFRGRKWHVLQNPANTEFFRLSEAAYRFMAMLDGRRSVGQIWRVCMDAFGDAAPTQNEVIQTLGQLYAANLLQGDLDAGDLFRRSRKRARRDVKGLLSSVFSIRIPLLDPDTILDRWVGLVGPAFTVVGFLLWAGAIGAGFWALIGRFDALLNTASGVLAPGNLPLLYAGLVIVKVFHEMGHAFACKHFGKQAGSGGEVHQMGVTFLLLTPVPFVDASSAWALRSKWHRIVVGAAGMLVETAAASAAAVVWAYTAEGTALHAVAYNTMFVAGVSTLIFNGNPLLRYDAYYILLDLIEIPNLYARSRSYLGYLVKRYVWGLPKAEDPSHTQGERPWLVLYAAASTICRAVVLSAVVFFIAERLPVAGVLFGLILFVQCALVPMLNAARYLATDREIERVRGRAVSTVVAAAVLLLIAAGWVPAPDRCRIEGVLEPAEMSVIHAKTAGCIRRFLESGSATGPGGPPVIESFSLELDAQRDRLLAEMRLLRIRRQLARDREAVQVQILDEKIAALVEQIERTERDLLSLVLASPISGTWVAPEIERMQGVYVKRGQSLGVVADFSRLRIRAVAGQAVAARLIREARPEVDIRVKGRSELKLTGRIEAILPAGHEKLPSAALGYAAGGAMQIDTQDSSGRRTAEPFFEIRVTPLLPERVALRSGQTLALRFDTAPKPLIVQGWRSLRQLFQRRFQI